MLIERFNELMQLLQDEYQGYFYNINSRLESRKGINELSIVLDALDFHSTFAAKLDAHYFCCSVFSSDYDNLVEIWITDYRTDLL